VLQVVGGAAEATLVAGAVPGSAAVLLAGGGAAAAEEDPGWSLLCTSRTGVPIPAATKMVAKIDNVGIITLEHLEFAVQFELKLKHPLFLELFNEVFGEYVRPADLAEVPRKGRVELVPVDPHLAAAEASLLDQGLDLLRDSVSGGMKLNTISGGAADADEDVDWDLVEGQGGEEEPFLMGGRGFGRFWRLDPAVKAWCIGCVCGSLLQCFLIYKANVNLTDVINVVLGQLNDTNTGNAMTCLQTALQIYPGGGCQLIGTDAATVDASSQPDFEQWQSNCNERAEHFRFLALALPILSLLSTIVFNGWAWCLIFLKKRVRRSDFEYWHKMDVVVEVIIAIVCVFLFYNAIVEYIIPSGGKYYGAAFCPWTGSAITTNTHGQCIEHSHCQLGMHQENSNGCVLPTTAQCQQPIEELKYNWVSASSGTGACVPIDALLPCQPLEQFRVPLDITMTSAYTYLWFMYIFPFGEGIIDLSILSYHLWHKLNSVSQVVAKGVDTAVTLGQAFLPRVVVMNWYGASERNTRWTARFLTVMGAAIVVATGFILHARRPYEHVRATC